MARLSQTIQATKTGNALEQVWLTYSGEVTPLPGCPDIAVSHALYCHHGSGKGGGHKAMQERLIQLKEMGYSAVMCTVNVENVAQKKILEKAGWHLCVPAIHNKRTDNHVCIAYKEL